MWLKKLRRKKLQCLLIGLLLFLSSLIFTTSLSMMTSISGYVNKYYSNKKFYEINLFHPNGDSIKNVESWSKHNPRVKDVKVFKGYTSGNDIYHKGKNIKLEMYDIMPLENMKNIPFGITKIKSLNKSMCPLKGEAWITQLLADNYKIKLGDTLTVKTKNKNVELKVSSLINDSLMPSSTSSQIFIYVNKNNLSEFSALRKTPLILIDIKDGANLNKVEKDLSSHANIGAFAFDRELMKANATSIPSMMGGMASFASIMIFILTVLLIRFILWNNILKEYKLIGIYKALGFPKRELRGFYIIGYSLTALIGSFLGAIGSIPVLDLVAPRVLKYIGRFKGVDINFAVILGTVILFSSVVIINLYLVIRKTNKISPVEALRVGVTSSRKKLTKSFIKESISPLALSINDMFKYKKITAFITLSLSVAISLVLYFGNMNVTILKMKDNTNVWFGIPKGDITISGSMADTTDNLKNVVADIKHDNRVKSYVYGSMFLSGIVKLDTDKYPIKNSASYSCMVINSYKRGGFTIIKGHNPENSKEVSVSLNILKDSGLTVGDYIELSINNKKEDYLISGSYNSMMADGYSMRLLSSSIKKQFPQFIGSELFVILKSGVNKKSFKSYINDKYPNLDASDIHPMLKYSIDSIPGTLLPISSLLIVVFIVFSSITILNIIIMNIRDNRRNFGIMKSLGFTSKEMTLRYLYRILILTIFSSLIAIVFNLGLSKDVTKAVIMNMDVLIISPVTMVLLLAAMISFVIIITIVCCKAIKDTKPTELIEE